MDFERMRQNLKDAGCGDAVTEEILMLYQSGRYQDSLRMMKKDRCRLMEELHESGRKVDCLDFLIRKMERKMQADH